MSDVSERRGTCLCGDVTITAKAAHNSVGACHCNMCRRWSGGPLMAIDCGTDVDIDGEENIAVFPSSTWAERGFCRKCGTHLFYRLTGTGQYIIPVGVFDDDAGFEFETQVFVDERPSYYQFANKTTDMTAAEVFAKYGAPD